MQNVNIHNGKGEAWSPNNARFSTIANQAYSSFWSVVVSPDAKTVLITFNVLANTDEASTALREMLNKKINRGTALLPNEVFVVNNLCTFIPALNDFAARINAGVIRGASTTFKDLLTNGQSNPLISLTFDLCSLDYRLKLLEYSLGKLSSN